MAIEDEVLVIGGGLAGLTAAVTAARKGARTRLVTHRKSTLRNASGLVDVLGYVADSDVPLTDPFAGFEALPERHPYRLVGEDAIREGLALFDEVAGDRYLGSHTDANALVPTHGGAVKPTARYPRATAAGLASDDRDMLLVGFEGLTGFDAPLAAAHLDAAGVPFAVRGATVAFPGSFPADAKPTRYARALQRDELSDGSTVRERLAERVAAVHRGEPRVGFPALLGEGRPDAVRDDLERRLGAEVFEVPMGPPSVPGMRLEDALHDAAEAAGVRISSGNPIVDFDGEDRIRQVVLDRKGVRVPHAADQYVLATGGPVSGGVESDRERVTEPVFGLHVPHPTDRYDWFEDDVWGDHAYLRFGVDIDRTLRPRDSSDAVAFENLRAAGAVLGGYDWAAEKSGSGVSLATGVTAGTLAAEQV